MSVLRFRILFVVVVEMIPGVVRAALLTAARWMLQAFEERACSTVERARVHSRHA